MKKTHLQFARGFTLIEIIVAVGIFAMVMLVTLGAILAVVDANRKAQAYHSVLNSLNLSLETMLRDLRTGYDYSCSGCDSQVGGSKITFKSNQVAEALLSEGDPNPVAQSVTYELKDFKIQKTIGSGDSFEMTPDAVEITSMNFFVSDTDRNDGRQAKILLTLTGQGTVGKQTVEFNIQTFVSQRRLDF